MIRGYQGVLERVRELDSLIRPRAQHLQQANAPARSFGALLSDAVSRNAGQASADRGYIDALVRQASAKYGVNERLVHAVVRAESDYNPQAVSHAGAMGLMQLMPENCRDYGVGDPFDPAQNIDGGVRHLKDMLDQFGRLDLALAGYNAGPGAVRRHGGIPPYRETQAYVTKIMGWLSGT